MQNAHNGRTYILRRSKCPFNHCKMNQFKNKANKTKNISILFQKRIKTNLNGRTDIRVRITKSLNFPNCE